MLRLISTLAGINDGVCCPEAKLSIYLKRRRKIASQQSSSETIKFLK